MQEIFSLKLFSVNNILLLYLKLLNRIHVGETFEA